MAGPTRTERVRLLQRRVEALQAELGLCIQEIVELADAESGVEPVGARSRVRGPTSSRPSPTSRRSRLLPGPRRTRASSHAD